MIKEQLLQSPLGKEVDYINQYDPSLLCPISRAKLWQEKDYSQAPFKGVDIWNAYEISWLNTQGLPCNVIGEFWVPSDSPNLVESKSFKLYLNSYSQTKFNSIKQVRERLTDDLSSCVGKEISVSLHFLSEIQGEINFFRGCCLDNLKITINDYTYNPNFLSIKNDIRVDEEIFSHLLRSRCPVTGQADWGSLYIKYTGHQIEHENLLKYIISYREHEDFHEQCVENIFLDIFERCRPDELTVYARYLRRGGLDINPYRSTSDGHVENIRLLRQ